MVQQAILGGVNGNVTLGANGSCLGRGDVPKDVLDGSIAVAHGAVSEEAARAQALPHLEAACVALNQTSQASVRMSEIARELASKGDRPLNEIAQLIMEGADLGVLASSKGPNSTYTDFTHSIGLAERIGGSTEAGEKLCQQMQTLSAAASAARHDLFRCAQDAIEPTQLRIGNERKLIQFIDDHREACSKIDGFPPVSSLDKVFKRVHEHLVGCIRSDGMLDEQALLKLKEGVSSTIAFNAKDGRTPVWGAEHKAAFLNQLEQLINDTRNDIALFDQLATAMPLLSDPNIGWKEEPIHTLPTSTESEPTSPTTDSTNTVVSSTAVASQTSETGVTTQGPAVNTADSIVKAHADIESHFTLSSGTSLAIKYNPETALGTIVIANSDIKTSRQIQIDEYNGRGTKEDRLAAYKKIEDLFKKAETNFQAVAELEQELQGVCKIFFPIRPEKLELPAGRIGPHGPGLNADAQREEIGAVTFANLIRGERSFSYRANGVSETDINVITISRKDGSVKISCSAKSADTANISSRTATTLRGAATFTFDCESSRIDAPAIKQALENIFPKSSEGASPFAIKRNSNNQVIAMASAVQSLAVQDGVRLAKIEHAVIGGEILETMSGQSRPVSFVSCLFRDATVEIIRPVSISQCFAINSKLNFPSGVEGSTLEMFNCTAKFGGDVSISDLKTQGGTLTAKCNTLTLPQAQISASTALEINSSSSTLKNSRIDASLDKANFGKKTGWTNASSYGRMARIVEGINEILPLFRIPLKTRFYSLVSDIK